MKRFVLCVMLTLLSFADISAKDNRVNATLSVEILKQKADSIAAEYLETAPMFLGYSVVLQQDQNGHLTTQTFPLDARFRYTLPEGLGVDGTGITVQLDSSFNPHVEMGLIAKGKGEVSEYIIPLAEAIKIFQQSFEGDENELSTVTLFHDASMTEPVYVFSIGDGLFLIGAVSRASRLMKK